MKNLYCVYDKVAKEFADPYPANNDDVASRMFVNTFKVNSSLHSQDYLLYCLGSYDFTTGIIVSDPKEIPITYSEAE